MFNQFKIKYFMKPFNLNEYLANPSREIITEAGHPVRIICTDAKAKYPIVALVETDGKERVFKYTENGSYLEGVKHKQDLYFKPATKKGWVNIFKPEINQLPCILTSVIYNTKEDALHFIKANKCANTDRIKTICIEWEEE